ncbi:hypothetical protein GGS21DRAFT_496968 [Xylaria nigripes]|nr:hypothetical protein GGS21DRAFT_496968 [Xylaria nigripes]
MHPHGGSSPTLTASTSTPFATPTSSSRSRSRSSCETAHYTGLASPPLLGMSSVSLPFTTLSANSWRTPYPRIGQFAITESEEVIAAGPDGLFYFRRVLDHDAQPWSKAQPLHRMSASLNYSSVSGLAIAKSEKRLDVYCVSNGVLHNFYRDGETDSTFSSNPQPPMLGCLVSGTPAVVWTARMDNDSRQWSLVVPCQSGGLLHTSTNPSSQRNSYHSCYGPKSKSEPIDHVATHLGMISAVSIVTVSGGDFLPSLKGVVAVCIASGRLHALEADIRDQYAPRWLPKTSTQIDHPGEVTGNPVLLAKTHMNQLDLLVPSAERGIFHFVRPPSTPDEWHMIARIAFPSSCPVASCLAVRSLSFIGTIQFRAFVQSGGHLYEATTDEGARPWSGSKLKPIERPGPSFS